MDYKIIEKEEFTVIGSSRVLSMKMHKLKFQNSGMSIINQEKANILLVCMVSVLTTIWEQINLNI